MNDRKGQGSTNSVRGSDEGSSKSWKNGNLARKRRQPTPGHPTIIHDASETTTAQIGAGGLEDLVRPEEVDKGGSDSAREHHVKKGKS